MMATSNLLSLVKDGDRLFQDSPDAGDPTCFCSRCGQLIREETIAIRGWVDEGRGGEYRYHPACLGMTVIDDEEVDDGEEELNVP
jgi:hypothetical protein